MSNHVVISGSLATGFTVTGPFPDWDSAYRHSDTIASPENGYLNEIFELREPFDPLEGDFVLLVGDPLTGYDMWGPFPFGMAAAYAGSPLVPQTVNPHDRQCVVFRLTPAKGLMTEPTAETVAYDVEKAAEALATVADNVASALTPIDKAVHRFIAEAADRDMK